MSQKKMTPIIAKAIAEQVREELKRTAPTHAETVKRKIKTSKEFKQLEKLSAQAKEISSKMDVIKQELEDKYSTKLADVSVYMYSSGESNITVRETSFVSVEAIKTVVLLEDYFSDVSETPEALVKRIADKIINSKH